MIKTLLLFALAIVAYFGLQADAPSRDNPWQPYALRKQSGKMEWVTLGSFKTYSECKFHSEKGIQGGYYQEPSGCLYSGYQSPYVQWLVNSVVANGAFKCIARMKTREKYDEALYSPVLRDYPADRSDNWDCFIKS